MFRWLRQSREAERRTFWACLSGWSLDALDAQIFSLVIPALLASWHVSHTDAGLIGSVTLAASALGGWLGGALADRFGRVRAPQITILWFAVATFASAMTQSFWQLFFVKGVQGLGFGAEWAAGAVLMAEVIRADHPGRALGAVQSGWAIGWGAAVLLYAATWFGDAPHRAVNCATPMLSDGIAPRWAFRRAPLPSGLAFAKMGARVWLASNFGATGERCESVGNGDHYRVHARVSESGKPGLNK